MPANTPKVPDSPIQLVRLRKNCVTSHAAAQLAAVAADTPSPRMVLG